MNSPKVEPVKKVNISDGTKLIVAKQCQDIKGRKTPNIEIYDTRVPKCESPRYGNIEIS